MVQKRSVMTCFLDVFQYILLDGTFWENVHRDEISNMLRREGQFLDVCVQAVNIDLDS